MLNVNAIINDCVLFTNVRIIWISTRYVRTVRVILCNSRNDHVRTCTILYCVYGTAVLIQLKCGPWL